MSVRSKICFIVLSAVFTAHLALAQSCASKSGFARQACEVQAANNAAAITGAANQAIGLVKGAPLTTSLSDAIHLDTLPASVDPKEFAPLLKLERTDDGAFILKPGFFELYVESFSLEPGDPNTPRGGAFFPAPIKGGRAKVIADILKFTELHPDVQQAYIQNLLGYTVLGWDLGKMPAPTQQAATTIIPKETLLQISAAAQTNDFGGKLLKMLGRKTGNSGTALSGATGAIAKAQALDKQYDITGTVKELKSDNAPLAAASLVRGTWAQMPGGFYVRYLPEGYARTRLQLIVPEAAFEGVDAKKPLTFDPARYLAVHAGTPAQRLGITLRPVGGR